MSALCPSYVKVMSLREHVQFQERICFNYRWCIESSCYVKQCETTSDLVCVVME